MKKAQTSFEYLLIIGGVIMIVVVASVFLRGSVVASANQSISQEVGEFEKTIEGFTATVTTPATLSPPPTQAPSTDTTPPVISGVTATEVGQTIGQITYTITWATDEDADSQVEYIGTAHATDQYVGSSTTLLDSNPVKSHSVTLTVIKNCDQYHFKVKSKDASRNLAVSGDNHFLGGTGLGCI